MIQNLSKNFAQYLARNGGNEKDIPVYTYGIECFLNTLCADVLLLLCGLLTHQVITLFIWSISFTLIRIRIGGIHAPTHGLCILTGTIIGLASLHLNKLWHYVFPWTALILLALCLCFSHCCAPVIHPNHPLSKAQAEAAKRKSFFFIAAEGIIAFVLFEKKPAYAAPIFSGIFIAVFMAFLQFLFLCHNKNTNGG